MNKIRIAVSKEFRPQSVPIVKGEDNQQYNVKIKQGPICRIKIAAPYDQLHIVIK